MKTYTVKLYEGVSREKVNETLKYYLIILVKYQ